MLINCPRCGFSQPKDQYCASCGVNMDTYVPQKKGLIEKLLSSTLLQVALVIGAALSISYFVLKQSTDDAGRFASRKQIFTSNTAPQQSTTVQPSEAAAPQSTALTAEENTAPTELSDENAKVELALQNEEQRSQLAGEAPTEKDTPGLARSSAENNKITSVAAKYSFYEVDRQLFNYWLQLNGASAQTDESGNVQAGVINAEILQKQLRNEPLKTETKKIGLDPTIFNAGINVSPNTPDQFMGLISEVTLQQLTGDRLQGSLKITRKNSQGTDIINVPLAISKQNAFFIHWRNSLFGFEHESVLMNVPPFQVLRSSRIENQTYLVIILEPYF